MSNAQLFIAILIIIGGFVMAVFEFLIFPFICMLAVFTVISAVILLWQDDEPEYAMQYEEIPVGYWDEVAADLKVTHIPVVFK